MKYLEQPDSATIRNVRIGVAHGGARDQMYPIMGLSV